MQREWGKKRQYWIQMVADGQRAIIPQGGARVHVWRFPLWNSDEMLDRALDICNNIIYCSLSGEQWTRLPPQSTYSADHLWLMSLFCFIEPCIWFIVRKSEISLQINFNLLGTWDVEGIRVTGFSRNGENRRYAWLCKSINGMFALLIKSEGKNK